MLDLYLKLKLYLNYIKIIIKFNNNLPLLYTALSRWSIIIAVNTLVNPKHLQTLLLKALLGIEAHSVLLFFFIAWGDRNKKRISKFQLF